MVNFIKLVNGSLGEENESPIIHYDMFDQLVAFDSLFHQDLFVSFRGSAKTTALHEYLILYIATYGEIPGFGAIDVGMYISDTMENGIKSMRNNLEFRWNNSDFLQKYVPVAKFTDIRWEFKNADGKRLAYRGFGATTGVRGFKEFGKRPVICGMDDLMSDKNADSPTITKDIKKIVYRAARQRCIHKNVCRSGLVLRLINRIHYMKLQVQAPGIPGYTRLPKNSLVGKISSAEPGKTDFRMNL